MMKQITRYLSFFFVIALNTQAFATETARIFHADRGTILLFESGSGQQVMVAGGALPNGAATAGDCFIEANINLKKSPNYYEGDFNSVHNEIVGIDQADIQGKGIGLYKSADQIRIGGAEVSGICADGIDFSGIYKEMPRGTPGYERNFLYFLNLSHQNSNYLLKHGTPKAAIDSLRPFIDTYDERWLSSSEDAKVVIPAINDYAFALQEAGDNTAALPLFQEIIKYQPDRTVAWLNMADAYWSTGNLDNAKKSYQQYTKLMATAGLQAKIPARVSARLKGQ
jgi:tetratricopeptide (TPR) repeat protein